MSRGEDLDAQAVAILRDNDRGGFTIPGEGLYPYQWNWDSAFVALGFATFDAGRAWTEIESLMAAQWPNGMVPHIIFRTDDPDYFPGPTVWGTSASPPTSGYSQPPLVASVLCRMQAMDGSAAGRARARRIFAKVLRWHRWFHQARDPEGLGIIAMAHPWEAGRDNSADWDAAMSVVNTEGVGEYTRRDTSHVNAEMRPSKEDYDRYLAIVKFGREHSWDDAAIADRGPFWVADVGTTMILLRADKDLSGVAEFLGEAAAAAEIDGWIRRAEEGVGRLWNPKLGAFCAKDLRTGKFTDAVTSACFLAWYAGAVVGQKADRLLGHLHRFLDNNRYAVPSLDPEHALFNPLRYWRGPSWSVINFLIGEGLRESGHDDLAERMVRDTRRLIETSGFYEYFCPLTGRGCGGANFSWTAAIWLSWASPSQSQLAA